MTSATTVPLPNPSPDVQRRVGRGRARLRADPPKLRPADFAKDSTSLNWSGADRKQALLQAVEILMETMDLQRQEAIQWIADRFVRSKHTVVKWTGPNAGHQPPPVEVIDVLRYELGIAKPRGLGVDAAVVRAALANPDHALLWPPCAN